MLRLAPSLLIFLVAGCADVDTQRPSLRVISPADAGEGPADLAVRLSARVDDGEASLVQIAVSVTSDVDGRLCKRAPGTKGQVVCFAALTEGEHLLTFVAEDASGNKRERSITWTATAGAEVDEPDGAWSGTLDLVMSGGLVSTCTGLIDLDIDRSADPAILGTATCESADAALTALTLSGAVDAFGLWSGTLSLLLDGEGPFSLDWTAGPGTTEVDGVVIGAANTTAYGEVQLSGSFAVER